MLRVREQLDRSLWLVKGQTRSEESLGTGVEFFGFNGTSA
jgi:hypothetical protein